MRSLHILLLFVASAVSADAQATTGRLRGTVRDVTTTHPIPGARVIIAATGRYVTTDSIGAFEVGQLPSGILRFIFAAEGFPRAAVVLAFTNGEVMTQDFELDSTAATAAADTINPGRRAQLLPAEEVRAAPSRGVRYEDFERRLKTGRGQYVTREQIEAAGYARLTDVVRSMRGVAIECGSGTACSIRMARAQMRCSPQYIVDGRPDNFFGPQVAIRDIEGIEVYTGASDVPGEFAGSNAGCGVIVIWTKNGPPGKQRP